MYHVDLTVGEAWGQLSSACTNWGLGTVLLSMEVCGGVSGICARGAAGVGGRFSCAAAGACVVLVGPLVQCRALAGVVGGVEHRTPRRVAGDCAEQRAVECGARLRSGGFAYTQRSTVSPRCARRRVPGVGVQISSQFTPTLDAPPFGPAGPRPPDGRALTAPSPRPATPRSDARAAALATVRPRIDSWSWRRRGDSTPTMYACAGAVPRLPPLEGLTPPPLGPPYPALRRARPPPSDVGRAPHEEFGSDTSKFHIGRHPRSLIGPVRFSSYGTAGSRLHK